MVTPSDPLEFLFSLERLGMKFGLENMTRLCDTLGHPERSFRSVLVAGTNGKGSVTVMVETALRAAGHRTARYTSPHLVRVEERFVLDGAEVSTDTLRQAAARVQQAAEALVRSGGLETFPTFFECATAIAFELFRRAAIEIAVLEVGLGGRLDATNVVTPIATAITSIDFDHQAQLGDSIESIAREKAGIIKPGVPVICGPLPAAADTVVSGIAAACGAPMVRASDRVRVEEAAGPDSSPSRQTSGPAAVLANPLLDLDTAAWPLKGIRLALSGRHQRDNAAVAVALLEAISRGGFAIATDAVRAGLTRADWPARLERFQAGAAEVLLDAAHNPAGARALASYLQDLGWSEVTLVFAAMQDKDVRGILEPLVPRCAAIVCTTAPTARALPAAALAALAAPLVDGVARIVAIEDPAAALADAVARGGRVVAAGSIFLIGPLRDILR
ncbi:MAG: cyanophycin synthetase [Acidobacteriota bacterium]